MEASSSPHHNVFINLTDNPDAGRHARRMHIRRIVMLERHKRRHEDKILATCAEKTPEAPEEAINIGRQQDRNDRCTGSDELSMDSNNARTTQLSAQMELWSMQLFQPRLWLNPDQENTTRLIIEFLCGQTKKAAQNISHVFFIHRRFNNVAKKVDMGQNPLKICGKNLKHWMGYNGTAVLQQSTLWTMCEILSKWKLLSAAQAIALYILLWLRKETAHSRFPCGNIALLVTLRRIFNIVRTRDLHNNTAYTTKQPVHDWHDWIYRESCLRVACLYAILTAVVETDYGRLCDGPSECRIEDLPLPAPKSVWEAEDERSWKESLVVLDDLSSTPTFQDLVGDTIPTDSPWQEEMDEMGLIVKMAAHLWRQNVRV
ncbi:hypothetical protein H2200_010075 [Cladophialophora chaetospira]|uniref:Transcription factor domain-containing protein n=1 Tax=Cladophialophora chaetospira TaxID=386627 RepID=A0AA38X249_9EURO|nr:hypothetical protein H2200_010075 [Cladophialophora chaetospira]